MKKLESQAIRELPRRYSIVSRSLGLYLWLSGSFVLLYSTRLMDDASWVVSSIGAALTFVAIALFFVSGLLSYHSYLHDTRRREQAFQAEIMKLITEHSRAEGTLRELAANE